MMNTTSTIERLPGGIAPLVLRFLAPLVRALVPALALAVAGCLSPRIEPATATDLTAVKTAQKCLVLLRLRCDTGEGPTHRGAITALACISRDERPSVSWSLPSPSASLSKDGWCAWWLPPGTYSLSIINHQPAGKIVATPDNLGPGIVENMWGQPGGTCGKFLTTTLWFEVRPDSQVLNLGSLRWRYRLLGRPALIARGMQRWSLEGFECTADEDGARRAARETLGTDTKVATAKIQFGLPGAPQDWASSAITYTPVSSTATLAQPGWVGRRMGRFTGVSEWAATPEGKTKSPLISGSGGGQGGAAILLLYLAYIPIGAALGSLGGAEQAHAMEATTRDFTEDLCAIDPDTFLARELTNRHPPPAPSANPAPALRCEVSVARAELRELSDPRGRFSLDLTAHLAWRRPDSGELVIERVFTSTAGNPPSNDGLIIAQRPFTRWIDASPVYKIKELTAPGAGHRLATDLRGILCSLAAAALAEWQPAANNTTAAPPAEP
jgi:hypothetical protein